MLINIHTKDDMALCLACENGRTSVAEYLVDNGANIHAKNNYALRMVCQNGYAKIAKMLIKNDTTKSSKY